MEKYHRFDLYCQQYQRLCKELGEIPKKCSVFTDRHLLEEINWLLIKLNCIPMDDEELETELN